MQVHLLDAYNNTVLASTTIEASPKDLGAGGNLNLFGVVDGGGQYRVPMQEAIRACMEQAAIWAGDVVLNLETTAVATSGST